MSVGLSALVLGARLVPDAERCFPLSRYPMFSTGRARYERLVYAEVVHLDGSIERLGMRWWTSGGVSTGRNRLARVAKGSKAEKKEFCEALAARVGAADPEAERVAIRNGRFSAENVMRSGEAEPQKVITVIECPVSR